MRRGMILMVALLGFGLPVGAGPAFADTGLATTEDSSPSARTGVEPPAAPPVGGGMGASQSPAAGAIQAGSLTRELLRADPGLAALLEDVRARNPELAAAREMANVAAERPAQAGALPDPMLMGTGYVMRPQTRTGPSEAMLSLSQTIPWFGKRGLKADAARLAADANARDVTAMEIDIAARARRLYYELSFLDAEAGIVSEDKTTLEHYEELARARYSSGVGLEQAVVKVQAEITRAEARLLDIRARRASVLTELNRLRDRAEDAELAIGPVPRLPELRLDADSLRVWARSERPEVLAADAQIDRTRSLEHLAGKAYYPDVTLGLGYTVVGERDDPAGRATPPADNGDDVLAITAGINLPIWRGRLASGVEEARHQTSVALARKRAVVAQIDRNVSDLASRLPLIWDRVRLFETVLTIQTEQSLESAESAYMANTASALDLLDAERVRLEARVATERARTDYAIAWSDLTGALGEGPSPAESSRGEDR
ncbi:MAG: TolC family protein [Candidatus Eisenbacteria bacterium]|uniref:TolC family protein n=1 Tax=Eiseniibacteriota bacterium TaxID=2212470 RepID=A0A956NCM7_UNCEI|nr:TolC family protein [Candidatus Eisenbacteria bacterium]